MSCVIKGELTNKIEHYISEKNECNSLLKQNLNLKIQPFSPFPFSINENFNLNIYLPLSFFLLHFSKNTIEGNRTPARTMATSCPTTRLLQLYGHTTQTERIHHQRKIQIIYSCVKRSSCCRNLFCSFFLSFLNYIIIVIRRYFFCFYFFF